MKGLPFKKDHHTTNVAITLLPASWLFRIAAPKNFHLIKNHFVVVTGLDSWHCMKANQCSFLSGVQDESILRSHHFASSFVFSSVISTVSGCIVSSTL